MDHCLSIRELRHQLLQPWQWDFIYTVRLASYFFATCLSMDLDFVLRPCLQYVANSIISPAWSIQNSPPRCVHNMALTYVTPLKL